MDTDLTEAAAPVDAFWANPKAFDKKRASEIDDVPLESWCITLNLFNLQQTAPMLQRAQNCADAHYHVNARRQKNTRSHLSYRARGETSSLSALSLLFHAAMKA